MAQIIIDVTNCKNCPHFKTGNQWSSDGCDGMEDWISGKEDKTTQSSVEWHEEAKIEIPNWCTCKKNKEL